MQWTSPWRKILEKPQPREHVVQLYQPGEPSLIENVGLYIHEGWKRGDAALVIATAEHINSLCVYLEDHGAAANVARRSGKLVVLEAEETLSHFMIAGQPDWDRFEATMRGAMRQLRPATDAGLRAYGEMVGILWNERQYAAAVRLEQYWNRLLEQSAFSLFCSYEIDIFGREFHVENLDGVLCTHTHLMPTDSNGKIDAAINRAFDEVLGGEAETLRMVIRENPRKGWAVLPSVESVVLWLHHNRAAQADRILELARHYYSEPAH